MKVKWRQGDAVEGRNPRKEEEGEKRWRQMYACNVCALFCVRGSHVLRRLSYEHGARMSRRGRKGRKGREGEGRREPRKSMVGGGEGRE